MTVAEKFIGLTAAHSFTCFDQAKGKDVTFVVRGEIVALARTDYEWRLLVLCEDGKLFDWGSQSVTIEAAPQAHPYRE